MTTSSPLPLPSDLTNLLRTYVETSILTREPNQTIRRHGDPYIRRHMLGRKIMVPVLDVPGMPVGWAGGIPSEIENIYVHEFIRSDKDDPHCHPWPNITVLLRGWYWENVYNDDGTEVITRQIRHPGDIVIRSANAIHAIEETSPDCLSLFITGRKEKEWGFWVDGKFVPWEDYHVNSAGM